MRQPFASAALVSVCFLVSCGSTNLAPNDCTNPATCPANVQCSPSALRCGPERAVQKCKLDGSGWEMIAHCTERQACSGGQCSPAECSSSATRCTSEGLIQTCLPQVGQYSEPTSCPTNGDSCIGTSCIPRLCERNQRFCGTDTEIRQCDGNGSNSVIVENCQGTLRCINGSCRE